MFQFFRRHWEKRQTLPEASELPRGRHIKTGKKGQVLAEAFFQKQGLKILARNYRCILGELDLVLLDGSTVVFAEVKCRKSRKYGSGLHAITHWKREKIMQTSLYFLKSQKKALQNRSGGSWPPSARFDVLAILLEDPEKPYYEWIPNAFEGAETYTF